MEEVESLVAFSSGFTLTARIAGLSGLIADRKIQRAAKEPRFQNGFDFLVDSAKNAADSRDRLLSVAAISRIAALVKSFQGRAETVFSEALREPLPPLDNLPEPEDRYYVARACGLAKATWCVPYLAGAAVSEEGAEIARAELVKSLISQVGDVRVALENLLIRFRSLEIATESPGKTAARRLRRLLTALREAMSVSDADSGPSAGTLLADLVRVPLKKWGQPTEWTVAKEVAEETIALVHELIRLKFSMATEADTYKSLRVAERWVSRDRWRSFATSSRSSAMVARDLNEALTMLVRQDKIDDGLFSYLELMLTNREEARAAARKIADETAGLSMSVREWLTHGSTESFSRAETETEVSAEDRALNENRALADLLVDAQDLLDRVDAGGSANEPTRASTPKEEGGNVALAAALADGVRAFAMQRSLELRGHVGDIVEYAPREHEIVGRGGVVRRVIIRRPAVLHARADSVRIVIKKALVEPSD